MSRPRSSSSESLHFSVPPEAAPGIREVLTTRVEDDQHQLHEDLVSVEEPLEIRVTPGDGSAPLPTCITVTMRTPGHDRDLAAGFLHAEGLLDSRRSLDRIVSCAEEGPGANVVNVILAPGVSFDAERFARKVTTTSSCGICGRTSLEQIEVPVTRGLRGDFVIPIKTLTSLPDRLRAAQPQFAQTGGLHAAGLFDSLGSLICVREDVGRHNAVDKIVGARLLGDRLPAHDTILMVSGRASFELVQKAVLAGIPALAAVGAPSSLAVELATRHGMTLVGFLRGNRGNVYAGRERIACRDS